MVSFQTYQPPGDERQLPHTKHNVYCPVPCLERLNFRYSKAEEDIRLTIFLMNLNIGSDKVLKLQCCYYSHNIKSFIIGQNIHLNLIHIFCTTAVLLFSIVVSTYHKTKCHIICSQLQYDNCSKMGYTTHKVSKYLHRLPLPLPRPLPLARPRPRPRLAPVN